MGIETTLAICISLYAMNTPWASEDPRWDIYTSLLIECGDKFQTKCMRFNMFDAVYYPNCTKSPLLPPKRDDNMR